MSFFTIHKRARFSFFVIPFVFEKHQEINKGQGTKNNINGIIHCFTIYDLKLLF